MNEPTPTGDPTAIAGTPRTEASDRPPGRCSRCNQDVALEHTQRKENGMRFHRWNGAWCGPVLTEFLYHVAAWIQPPDRPGMIKAFALTLARPAQSPEDYAAISVKIASQFQAMDASGAAIVGAKPEVDVVVVQLLKAR